MTKKLLVPDIGDFENVEVIELLVKEGQEIKKNDPVVTIESDKSSVEIPSILSGKIESIKVKVGDKVSKGDLILDISNSNQSSSESKVIPKDTENLIQEAENTLKKTQKKKPETIQVVKDGDIDPLETNEWLESLLAVIEKDGNQRAHYLIKELINKAYIKGDNIPYTQHTPYINTIQVIEEK
jgi:pyruvate dehydrogenase E1 component